MRVLAYSRVSTAEQGAEGYSLGAQAERMARECAVRGWTLLEHVEEVRSSKKARPALDRALYALENGQADVLMVARLDRLSRSVGQFATMMDAADRQGWSILCLDPAVDMTTPYGRAMAGMAAVFAQLERELISQRTREGLHAAMARGVRVGHPDIIPEDTVRYIQRLRDSGLSLSKVAALLNAEGVEHPLGCAWSKNAVHRLLARRRKRA